MQLLQDPNQRNADNLNNVRCLSQYLTNLMHKNLFHNKFYFMRHEIKPIVKQILCIKLVKY